MDMDEDQIISEWEKRRYVPKPGQPELPPQLQEMRGKSAEEAAAELKKMPFFMTQLDENEPNEMVEALQALAYEGEPDEVAGNFKFQGNECYQAKKYHDAIEFYTKALQVQCGVDAINLSCYLNRAMCNLELRNFRRCINDCKLALKIDGNNIKALYRSAKAYHAVDRNEEAIDCLNYALTLNDSPGARDLLEKASKRQEALREMEKKRKAKEEVKLTKKRNLELAIQSRRIKQMTVNSSGVAPNAEEMKIQLADDMDPHSDLLMPILCLYPLEMESDMIQPQPVDETVVGDVLNMIFESAPGWFQKSKNHEADYKLANLQVFAQTATGGLASVGKKSTVAKLLATPQPVLPAIDNTCRLYIVPKNRVKEFTSSWEKQAAANMLYSIG